MTSFGSKRYHIVSNILHAPNGKQGIALQECGHEGKDDVLIVTPTESGKSYSPEDDIVSIEQADEHHVALKSISGNTSFSQQAHSGPCRYSSQKFRDGWDMAFGQKKLKEPLN
jgi:hypothetical protein